MELIAAPVDFLGVNYYSPHYVGASETAGPSARTNPRSTVAPA